MNNINFGKDLLSFSEEELKAGLNNWSPQFGALAVQELTRRQLISLEKAIEGLSKSLNKSSKENQALERSNYRLQIALLVLTAVTTTIAVFPILQTIIGNVVTFFARLASFPQVSGVVSEFLSMFVSLVAGVTTAAYTYWFAKERSKLRELLP